MILLSTGDQPNARQNASFAVFRIRKLPSSTILFSFFFCSIAQVSNQKQHKKTALEGSASILPLKTLSFLVLQIDHKTAPHPNITTFLSILLKLWIQGPNKSSVLVGMVCRLRAIWTTLQMYLATEHLKNKWSVDSKRPQNSQLDKPCHLLLHNFSLVRILFLALATGTL